MRFRAGLSVRPPLSLSHQFNARLVPSKEVNVEKGAREGRRIFSWRAKPLQQFDNLRRNFVVLKIEMCPRAQFMFIDNKTVYINDKTYPESMSDQ